MAEQKRSRPAGAWLVWSWVAMCLILLAVISHTQAPLVALDCPYNEQDAQSQSSQDNCAALPILFLRSWNDLTDGIGGFIHRNRDDITAASTAVIAIFTCTLWWVTWRMVRLAEGQQSDMRESLRIAGISADATKSLADAALAMELPVVLLSHIDFVAAAPTMDMRTILERCPVKVTVTNYGRTPAFLTQRDVSYVCAKRLPDIPNYIFESRLPPEAVLDTRVSFDLGEAYGSYTGLFGREITKDDIESVIARTKHFFVYGYVACRDFQGNPHRTGFCKQLRISYPNMSERDWEWGEAEAPAAYTERY